MIKERGGVIDPIKIAIIGLGKIARDQHLPAIHGNPAYKLVATASPDNALDGIASYKSLDALIANDAVDAVAICTPPAIRHLLARQAIDAGLHVLLEKPPAATPALAQDLLDRGVAAHTTVFAAWHSREAAAVDAAREALRDRQVESVAITWREDIRRWHPGQEWILDPDGFGVFDPAINAFSILTSIVSEEISVDHAVLDIPAQRAAPIAAHVGLRLASGAPVTAELDFLQTGQQIWSIDIATDRGALSLSDGGARLVIDGEGTTQASQEYPRLYARFAELVASARCDVDLRPLAIVEEIQKRAKRRSVAAFNFD